MQAAKLPEHPLRIVVEFPAGGASNVVAGLLRLIYDGVRLVGNTAVELDRLLMRELA